MRKVYSVAIGLVAGALVAVSATGATAAASERDTGAEREAFSLINEARSERSLGKLRWNEKLAAVAARHSQRMAEDDQLYHNGNIPNEYGSWDYAFAENIGYGPDVEALHDAFMKSTGHRTNILGRFSYAGVGVVWRDETLWITQVFMEPQESERRTASVSKPRRTKPRAVAARKPRARNAQPMAARGVTRNEPAASPSSKRQKRATRPSSFAALAMLDRLTEESTPPAMSLGLWETRLCGRDPAVCS